MKKRYVNEKKVASNHTGLTSTIFMFLVALPILSFVNWLVFHLFKFEATFHWLSLVIYSAFYIFVGLSISNSTNYAESRFLQKQTLKGPMVEGKVQRWYFLDPVGLTLTEIDEKLKERFCQNNYLKKGRQTIAIGLAIGLALAGVACIFTKWCLNGLVTYPLVLIAFFYGPSANAYVEAVFPQASYLSAINWPDCICPDCGTLCDPRATVIADKRRSTTLGSYTSTSTDKYTDGETTVYVEREEVRPSVHTSASWTECHQCPRCGKSFHKKNGYSTVDRY